MLGSYLWAAGSQVVIIFNSGGWGWSSVSESFGWMSIIDGIEDYLGELGYRSTSFDYRRRPVALAAALVRYLKFLAFLL